jgi:hypothetical protein
LRSPREILSLAVAALQQSGLCLPPSGDRSIARRETGTAAYPARKASWQSQSARSGEAQHGGRKGECAALAANVRPIIDEIIAAGAMSHNAIAAKLNERRTHVQVGAILHPFDGASAAA